MWLTDELAETRIADAIRTGQLENLPGAGERISLEQDMLVPEDLRVAYRLLKMSGHMPPELCLLNEIRDVEQLLLGLSESEQRSSAIKRLNLLRVQLGVRAENLLQAAEYSSQIMNKLDSDAQGK